MLVIGLRLMPTANIMDFAGNADLKEVSPASLNRSLFFVNKNNFFMVALRIRR
jgi:hypothetical protein